MSGTDVLIIGAGSAGSVLADRLSRDPSRTVTVLEAGTRITDPDMRRPELWPFIDGQDYDWAYRTTPQPGLAGRSLEWPRGKGIGGSSTLHAMAHMRGCRADFERWVEATGDRRWSWDALLPAFESIESRRPGEPGLTVIVPGPELSSPLVADYLAAWGELGVERIPDHNRGEMIGATPNSLTIADGRRVTASDAFLDPALGRPNLHLVDRATVHTLLIDRGRVVGARYERDGRLETIHADVVVLAAGAVADPLLLMRSGVGDPQTLRQAGVTVVVESPGVGSNLHDHLLGAGNVYRSATTVPPTKLQLSESMTYLSANGLDVRAGAPDIVVGCVVGPSASEVYRGELDGLPTGGAYTFLFGVTNPTSRGSLRISGPDVDDAPIIDPQYLSTEHDRALFRTAFEHARLVGGAEALAGWRSDELLPGADVTSAEDIDAFIQRAAITHHHPVGTLRMGAEDAAPVTPGLALRALDGCYVVDASVIPSITAGPVHAAVLAIAETFARTYAD
ncbi:GMC family oxidoreductase [Leifsonia xyli]|uniref:GMC family oxidoreductase n=1 Tax=Leifsonia xyli TaxID=1575 RepID=UPI003D6760B4